MTGLRALTPILLLSLAAGLWGCDKQSATDAQQGDAQESAQAGESAGALNGTLDIAKRGSVIPEFPIALPDGATKNLRDLAGGKPMLVNLWASWCGPCVIEMPMLDRLAQKQAGKLIVLTVNQDMEGAEKAVPVFAKGKYKALQPWLDPENRLGFHYATGLMPTTVLYDAQGREVWRMTGGHDWDGPRTAALLADTLSAQ